VKKHNYEVILLTNIEFCGHNCWAMFLSTYINNKPVILTSNIEFFKYVLGNLRIENDRSAYAIVTEIEASKVKGYPSGKQTFRHRKTRHQFRL